jgi:hypothetical protein
MWRNAVLCWLALVGTLHVQASFLVGLTYEYVGSVDSLHTYRIYAEFDNPGDELVALYGEAGAPWSLEVEGQLFQAETGGPVASAGGDTNDSWFTIGEDGTAGAPSLYQVGMTEAWAAFESGAGFVVESAAGGSIFTLPGTVPSALAGSDGKVLIAQLTMTGTAELTLNLQWRTPGGITVPQPGVFLAFPEEVGCTDEEACNYDPNALVEDGSCTYITNPIFDCNGDCTSDADDDGICDELEILGCTLPQADNFNALATEDDGNCIAPGCTDETASNFVPWALQEDGSCFWLRSTTAPVRIQHPAFPDWRPKRFPVRKTVGSCTGSMPLFPIQKTNWSPYSVTPSLHSMRWPPQDSGRTAKASWGSMKCPTPALEQRQTVGWHSATTATSSPSE